MTAMPYAEIDDHGTPAGYLAGCKTDAMCDPKAPWSCRRARERYRGDYEFHQMVDRGMSPQEIHELEQSQAARIAEQEAAWLEREGMKVPAKPKTKRAPLVEDPDRLAAYGQAATAAKQRIASAPTPDDNRIHAYPTDAISVELAKLSPSQAPTPKETPMSDPIPLPSGLAWKQPSARALASLARGSKTKNETAIAAAKQKPGEWLSMGVQNASGMTRWRKGEVAGTKPGEFEAIVDVEKPGDKVGELFIRYVGAAQ